MEAVLKQTQFEMHSTSFFPDEFLEADRLPWQESAPAPLPPPLVVTDADGLTFAALHREEGRLVRVESAQEADFALKVARRKLNGELVLMALGEPVLVNGVPAPPLVVLSVGDAVTLGAGHLAHVTERVIPYVGPPTGELIGKKCAHCRLAATAETRIVTHRCGVIYHHETEESHPHLAKEDRLNCFEKVGTCHSCKREMNLHPHLVWDPRSL